jgi:hypothetical protein
MDGFGTYLPLSLDISLSFGGSSVCLSLLLSGMADISFSLSLSEIYKQIQALIATDADLSALGTRSAHKIVL